MKNKHQSDHTLTIAPSVMSLRGQFGEIVLDAVRPSVIGLRLRQGNGDLSVKSLLSAYPSETLPYTTGAYTYVQDLASVRYESTASRNHRVEKESPTEIIIRNIELLPDKLHLSAPVIEDWHFSVTADGDLQWEIVQRWQRDFEAHMAATPGLFFNVRANAMPTGSGQRRLNPEQNAVATLLWAQPATLEKSTWRHFELHPPPAPFSESMEPDNCVFYTQAGAWMRAKLYTSFPHDRDLYLRALNAHLFRRGKYNSHSELGVAAGLTDERYRSQSSQNIWKHRKILFQSGQVVNAGLVIGSRAATETGHQLSVDIPDRSMQTALTSFYNGLANTGIWTSLSYEVGNQVDGWKIPAFWMPVVGLSVGSEAPQPLSADHYAPLTAYRVMLETWLKCVDAQGKLDYGFTGVLERAGHVIPEASLSLFFCLERYALMTGDVQLPLTYLAKLELIIQRMERYRVDDLLVFDQSRDRILIYFDAWAPDGTITYLNSWYAKALESYALFLRLAGRTSQSETIAAKYRATVQAMNARLWDDHAFGENQGGYVDFIDRQGKRQAFFNSATEYMPIVFGISSVERGRKILATADKRIAELTAQYGYRGDATLDTLWPVESMIESVAAVYPFGTYQNGSILNCWTYFEVVARCLCGDVAQAHERLKNFAEHAARTNWFEGDSAFNIRSEAHGWSEEPYLSDQIAVTAALVHGLLGIRPTWDKLEVTPRLPASWKRASAELLYKGKRMRVEITGATYAIQELVADVRRAGVTPDRAVSE